MYLNTFFYISKYWYLNTCRIFVPSVVSEPANSEAEPTDDVTSGMSAQPLFNAKRVAHNQSY